MYQRLLGFTIAILLGGCGSGAGDTEPVGRLGSPCKPDGTCDPPLECKQGTCVAPTLQFQPDSTVDYDSGGVVLPKGTVNLVGSPDAGTGANDLEPVDAAVGPGEAGPKADSGGGAPGLTCGPCKPGPCQVVTGCTVDNKCSYMLKALDAPCKDADPCTNNERCSANGVCVAGPNPTVCKPPNPAGGCGTVCTGVPNQCQAVNVGKACDLGLAGQCSITPTCRNDGTCKGTPRVAGFPCNDGKVCTDPDTCDGAGKCAGPLIGYHRILGIERVQSDKDNTWSTLQTKKWKVDRQVRGIRVHGSSNDGGFCYASWNTGHVVKYCHKGGWLCTDPANRSTTPTFDNAGNYNICQDTNDACDVLTLGQGDKVVNLPIGTEVTLKAAHTIGAGSDGIWCYMDVSCK